MEESGILNSFELLNASPCPAVYVAPPDDASTHVKSVPSEDSI